MAIREQGVVVQHAPLGSPDAFTVSSTAENLPDQPPVDRIKRVLIYTTEDLYWRDDGGTPSAVNGMLLPGDSFLVYDATAADQLQLVAAGADALVRIIYHGI